MDDQDLDLLNRYVRDRCRDAMEQLVRRNAAWVYAVAMRRLRDPQLADDVSQAVFLILMQKPPKVPSGSSLAAWLFKVTCYACSRTIRTESRRRQRERAFAMERPETGDEQCAMSLAEWEELAPQLDEAVQRLGRDDQEILLLRFYQQKSHADVAVALGISHDAARKRVQRAVGRLREMLSREDLVAPSVAVLIAGLEMHTTPATASAAVNSVLAVTQGASAVHAANIAKGVLIMSGVNKTIGIVATVAALLAVGVGTVVVLQPQSPDKPAPTTHPIEVAQASVPAAPPAADWRTRFDQVYRLDDAEMVKVIPPPFIPERLTYYTETQPGQARSIPAGPDSIDFSWRDGKLVYDGMSFGQVDRLSSIISYSFGLKTYEFELPPELANFRIRGDWIIRDGLSQEARLNELCAVIRQFGGPGVTFEQREVERPTIVVTGQFQYQPVNGDASRIQIHFYRDEQELADSGGGGGAGNLDSAIQRLGSLLKLPVITLITGQKPPQVGYSDHRSSSISRLAAGPERDQVVQLVLDHFAQQTGLKVSVEKRAAPVWVAVAEK